MAILGVCLAIFWGRIGELLSTSLALATAVAALTMPIAILLALLLGKSNLFGRSIGLIFLGSLLLLPLHQVASGWIAALGFRGWLSVIILGSESHQILIEGFWGAVVVHTAAAIPWATLLTIAAVRNTPARLEELALLDASQWRVFFLVTIPESASALLAITLLVMTSACTDIAATDLFQVRTFAEEVYTQAALGNYQLHGFDPTSGLVGFMAGIALLVTIVYYALSQLQKFFLATLQEEESSVWLIQLNKHRNLYFLLLFLLVGIFVLVPIVALLFKAGVLVTQADGSWQRSWSIATLVTRVLEAPVRHRREIFVSLQLASVVATSAVILGGFLAWALRNPLSEENQLCKRFMLLLIALLIALPGPLVGLMVIATLNQPLDSPVALLGELYGTWFAPWLAQTLRILPLATIALWPAMASVSNSLIEAAKADGASFLGRIWRIVFPNRWPALLATWLLAFGLSLGELSATALVVPPGTPPLSVRILSLLHYGVEDQVAAMSLFMILVMMILSMVGLSFYRVLYSKKKYS